MAPERTSNLPVGCDIVDQCNPCQDDAFYSATHSHNQHTHAPACARTRTFDSAAAVKIWLFNTPEANTITIFLSSPVALAVSLWGMTSQKIRLVLSLSQAGSR
jgi:hypothetical protein